MPDDIQTGVRTSSDLLDQYASLRTEEPRLFIRDAAKKLGVSEGELVAARCGTGVVRLDGRWEELVAALPGVGRVMTLARNDWAVHERKGTFENVKVGPHGGIVLGADIDLRINFAKWGFGFAVTDETKNGERASLQFFDKSGAAVQKIYRQEESNSDAWQSLIEQHVSDDQASSQTIQPADPAEPDSPDASIDVESMREMWRGMTDVHQFFGLLRKHNASRVQAFRLVGPEFAKNVNNDVFRKALEGAARSKIPIMIFVPSPGLVQIHTGPITNIKEFGDWFNVLDSDFNLHLLPSGIDTTWVVHKPTKDGIVTSVETFDAKGNQIAWMFGKRAEGGPERDDWRALTDDLSESSDTTAHA